MADQVTEIQRVEVVKGGERLVHIGIDRNKKGIHFNVKAHKDLEDYMFQLGGGETAPVSSIARDWLSDDPIKVYLMKTKIDPFCYDQNTGAVVDLNAVGRKITDTAGNINISFLRLVGISEGAGVNFTVRYPYSKGELDALGEQMDKAIRKFYLEYIRPVHVGVILTTFNEVQF